eukprot:scaffold185599_cov19-Tisochrysis_lutea.AAC.1
MELLKEAVELLKEVTVMPDMELDPWQARWQAFDNRNGLNPDPVAEFGSVAAEQAVERGQAHSSAVVCDRLGLLATLALEARQQSKQWSEAERKVFMDLFLQHPKEFRTIASALPGNRTAGDCVAFFYKHQKLDEWANVRRKQQLKKRK